jgi:DNA-binding LacI/PurR family transcriptional regulator
MKKAATIADIAQKTGVSKSTVSRALSGSTRISAATRRRIVSIAGKLNYEPNYLARSLSRSRTLSIGVILEDFMNPFFTEVAKGIETALGAGGYSMLLTSSGYVPEVELELTRTLLRNKVDGMLITPVAMNSASVRLLLKRKVPFFVMNEKSEGEEISWIDSDNLAGGYLAAEYLLKLGHRKFLILRNLELHGTRDRFEGIRRALDDRKIPLPDQVILDGAITRQDGRLLVDRFLTEKGRRAMPSAVVAVNDLVAIGVLESLFSHGIRVPEEVSIIGYDDIYIAGLLRVPLTTVHQAKYRMGQIAATGLLHMLDGRQKPSGQQFLIKPKLIIRESCKELTQ